MLGIPTRLGVQHIFTIPYKIDRLSVSHTILVDYIGCRMVNDIVMIYKTCNLRTECLVTVPVKTVCSGICATEDGLTCTRHQPTLFVCIEDIGVVGFGILVTLVVVDIRILVFSELISHSSFLNHLKSLTKSLYRQLAILLVIVVGLAIRTCAQKLSHTTILSLLKLLHQRRASPKIALAKIAESHELVDTQVVLS